MLRKLTNSTHALYQSYPLLLWYYLLCMAAFFFLDNAHAHLYLYIIGVLVSACLTIHHTFIQLLAKSTILRLIMIWIGYMLLTLLWSEDHALKTAIHYIGYSLLILSFIVTTCWLRLTYGQLFLDRLFMTMAVCAYIGASLSIIYMYTGAFTFFETRFQDFARGSNPMKSAALYGTIFLASSLYLCQKKHFLRWFVIGITIGLLVFILLTESRGPIIALTITACLVSLVTRRLLFAGLVVFVVSAIFALIYVDILPSYDLIERGLSERGYTFYKYVALIQDKPWFGHGIFPEIGIDHPNGLHVGYPHNIIIAHLLYGGIPGVFLLVASFYICLREAYRSHDIMLGALIVFMLLLGMFDFSHFIKPMGIEWVVLWLPVSLLMANEMLSAQHEPKPKD